MAIILVAIILVVNLLVDTGSYFIHGYWWLFYLNY